MSPVRMSFTLSWGKKSSRHSAPNTGNVGQRRATFGGSGLVAAKYSAGARVWGREDKMSVVRRRTRRTTEKLSVATERHARVKGRRFVAGACYVAMHNALGKLLVGRWRLPVDGRRAT